MGRIAGVTAAETRQRLLRAAADVFAERGYDGTRVADIAAAAGVSNGALYAHFGSKAELLVDALRTHGRRLLADVFAADPAELRHKFEVLDRHCGRVGRDPLEITRTVFAAPPGDRNSVVGGDPRVPAEVEELWTFVRQRGGEWLLSAIQQV